MLLAAGRKAMICVKQLLAVAALVAMPLFGAQLLHADTGAASNSAKATSAPSTKPSKFRPHRGTVYGNPGDTKDPLDPSNKGFTPRVVDEQGVTVAFPLKKAGGTQLYYGNGEPMKTPQGELAQVKDDYVRLNYGMRLDRDGHTYFMGWQMNHAEPEDSITRMATGWVDAEDMTPGGAAAAKAAIPRRLGDIEKPIAKDENGKPRTFTVNGANEQGKAAKSQDLYYLGVTGGKAHDRLVNFMNLHDGRCGLQMLMNLPDVPGGGICMDCIPNGTTFTAAADEHNRLITKSQPVYDKDNKPLTLTFIYGKAGETWGWVCKDWLD
jgi:hypothetical protein